ncbi:MAG: hypothetical protein P8Y37_09070 [Anaerolineales bacterium]
MDFYCPITSKALRFRELGTQFSAKMLVAVHLSEPLMLIIDLTSVVLAASFSLVGIQTSRFFQTSLGRHVQERRRCCQNWGG